jgi:predicted DNA-binding transcriptional regulator YafY
MRWYNTRAARTKQASELSPPEVQMSAYDKRDRTARLLKVEHILYEYRDGIRPGDIARLCGVSPRTTYRDLIALQEELKLPVWEKDCLYGIDRGHFLPPVKLTLQEALALFMSARLVARHSDERNLNFESAFDKLACVLPQPISQHVRDTVAEIAARREDDRFTRVLDILATAWATRKTVRIGHEWTSADGTYSKVYERKLDPYFIEPSDIGRSCYVIGHDHYSGEVRVFKIERIQQIELTADEYEIPEDWHAGKFLKSSWGIAQGEEVEIKIRFSPAVAHRLRESLWHSSQRLEDDPDGGVAMTVCVAGTLEITPWICSWGPEAEVLAPAGLRDQMRSIAERTVAAYAESLPWG